MSWKQTINLAICFIGLVLIKTYSNADSSVVVHLWTISAGVLLVGLVLRTPMRARVHSDNHRLDFRANEPNGGPPSDSAQGEKSNSEG